MIEFSSATVSDFTGIVGAGAIILAAVQRFMLTPRKIKAMVVDAVSNLTVRLDAHETLDTARFTMQQDRDDTAGALLLDIQREGTERHKENTRRLDRVLIFLATGKLPPED